eukprot:3568167-Amphidinium_carterae.1
MKLLSVPKAGAVAVDLLSRLPEEASVFLQNPEERMLVSSSEWGLVCEKGEHVKIYNDSRLRRRKTYLSLVEKLHECNLVDFIPA